MQAVREGGMKLLSFTGSPALGWDLKAKAVKEKVVLEPGGKVAVIIDRDADLADAWDRLEDGGIVINDVPSYRVDNMPYGGVKDSGLGREGIRLAMEAMSEIRNMVVRRT